MENDNVVESKITGAQVHDKLKELHTEVINAPVHDPVARGFLNGFNAKLAEIIAAIEHKEGSDGSDSSGDGGDGEGSGEGGDSDHEA